LITALWLLAIQGAFGAFDTIYYHEWRARLPALPGARPELRLHALRALIYAVLFALLPRFEWHGAWAYLLAALLAAEVCITLRDFVVEDRVRQVLGGVFAGERVTHALMAIIYGAMLANLLPALDVWRREATALVPHAGGVPSELVWLLTLMAVGVALSGARDAYAALGLPHGDWPWRTEEVKA
jgi:phosphatidylglycerophosphate synthase